MAGTLSPDEATWVLSCTDVGLAATVGEATFSRGIDYAIGGNVIAIATVNRGEVLMGTVSGNGLAPYQCLVTHKGDAPNGEPRWVSRCSCPVGALCKHAVAVIVASREVLFGKPQQSPQAQMPSNVISLFGDRQAASNGWRQRLDNALNPPAREPDLSPTHKAWRADLGLVFEMKLRPTSLTDSTPIERIEVRPTKLMRTKRWSKTVTWADVRSPQGVQEGREEHQGLLRAFIAARTVHSSDSTMFLHEFGPGLWRALADAVNGGITLMMAETPGEGVSLGAPAEVSLGVHKNDAGLVLTADASGVDLEPEFGSASLLGEPPHGVAVLDGGSLKLTPFVEPPHAVVQPLLMGDVMEIPRADVADFEANYLPRLRETTMVSDTSSALSSPLEPRLLIEATAVTVGHISIRTHFVYGSKRVSSTPQLSSARQTSSEAAVVARAGALLGRLRLTRAVSNFDLWVKSSADLHGMEAIRFSDAVAELRAIEGVDVELLGPLPAYEEADEDPIIEVGVNEAGLKTDWLNLQINISVEGEEVPYPNLIEAIHHGKDVMMLPSGTYFRLDSPQLLQIARVLDEAQQMKDKRSGELHISKYDIGLWDQLVGLGIVEKQRTAWTKRVEGLVRDGWRTDPVGVPESFTATLRPYQLDGFSWLAHLWDAGIGGVLADDMGLGKTMQTLAMLDRARAAGELSNEPVLVIAPTSVVGVWRREAQRFAPQLELLMLGETSKKRGTSVAEEVAAHRPHVVVTSYAIVRLDAPGFEAQKWRGLILDEAHMVKNYTSQTFQAIKKLGTPFGLAISGTPLENSVMDVWALFNLVAPGLFPTPDEFIRRYRKPIEQGEGHVVLDALGGLRQRIGPLMLRRRKQDVAPELPSKQTQIVEVEMSPQHERVYKRHLRREQQRVMGLLKDPDANRVEILAALTRLRRLALDPALVDDEFEGRQVSRKVEAVVTQLVDIVVEGHKALVFSQFTDFLKIVREAAADAGIASAYLDGATRHRQASIDEFTSGEADAFFISLKAGGTGLTLTEADYVIVLDPWWNPAAEDQAIDRAHRIGQTKHVMVYRYVSAATIEGKVVELQEKKRKLFADVVDAGSGGGKLSADDIATLLE